MDNDIASVGAEAIAIFSLVLGAVIEFAPYLLAGLAPPLSSTQIFQIGSFSVPQNLLYGWLFIGGGAFLLFYYLYWRVD